MKSLLHLGYEVGSGEAVEIPVRHMAVTGQTQESGKTTTLEALISRSGLSAIAFLTKRGEGSFRDAIMIAPYFQERTDWKFVQAIIESVLRSDQQSKQSWIMRACEGARTLEDVQRRARKLESESRNGFVKDMYMILAAYLDEVIPLIKTLPKVNRVQLQRGKVAVMDLVSYPVELQFLVIASTLQWIHEHEQGVITLIPEAWKFLPQSRNTPVKMAAEALIREGAGLKNYVWVDSQDMAGVDKIILRACAVWLVGVQREWNEVKRALSNMSAGLKKLSAGDVARLELGQFYACFGSTMKKVYVQPAWMEKEMARGIALGNVELRTEITHAPEKLKGTVTHQDSQPQKASGLGQQASATPGGYGEAGASTETAGNDVSLQDGPSVAAATYNGVHAGKEQPRGDCQPRDFDETKICEHCIGSMGCLAQGRCLFEELESQEKAMPPDFDKEFLQFSSENKRSPNMSLDHGWSANAMLAFARQCWYHGVDGNGSSGARRSGDFSSAPENTAPLLGGSPTVEHLAKAVIAQIRRDPAMLAEVEAIRPEIRVSVQKQVVQLDASTLRGKLALMIADGHFESPTNGNSAFNELKRRGQSVAKPNVYRELDKLAESGFLLKLENGYQAVSGMKISRQTLEVQQ